MMIDWTPVNISSGQTITYSTAYNAVQAANVYNQDHLYTISYANLDTNDYAHTHTLMGTWKMNTEHTYHKEIPLPSRDELMEFLTNE